MAAMTSFPADIIAAMSFRAYGTLIHTTFVLVHNAVCRFTLVPSLAGVTINSGARMDTDCGLRLQSA